VAELSTAVDNKLSVKVVILKNNSLAEVKFEQKEIGNPEYRCTLAPIDFVVSRRHAAPRASAANARRKVVARFRRH
jgi:thiamine pyrophosphate-dependent acetolactate synthase large subunit-like protein